MLCDSDFFKHLPVDSLIELGQDIEFFREVLVALIRIHLDANKEEDPFLKPSFSYKLLKEGSSEQNSRYLAPYVKECKTLPIDDLVLLGTQESDIALLILADLKESAEHFSISCRFAHEHADLRQEIAVELNAYLDTLPIKTDERKVLDKELPQLQVKYPEFNVVQVNNRVNRNNQVVVAQKKPASFLKCVSLASAGTFAYSWAAAALVFPPAVAPMAVVYGLGAGVSVGLGMGIGEGVKNMFFKKNAVAVPTPAPVAAVAPTPTPATPLQVARR